MNGSEIDGESGTGDGAVASADGVPSSSSSRTVRGRLSRTARIARWEVTRSAGTVDRRTVAAMVAVLLVVGVVGVSVVDGGAGLEDGIYVAAADEANPYVEVAEESPQFRTVSYEAYERGDVDPDIVLPPDGQIGYDEDRESGEPAADAFRAAIDDHNEELMAAESDEAAAYPVLVTLDYRDRDLEPSATDPDSDGGSDSAGTDGGDGGSNDGDAESDDGDGTDDGTENDGDAGSDSADSEPDDGSDGSGADSGADSAGGDEGAGDGDGGDGDGGLQVPDVGDGGLEATTEPGSPGTLQPPFPFQSLVLAFLFVMPMNFVIQAYGSTIMDERLKRRGELLLVSPASRYEIVAGKTLPYLLGLLGIVVGIAALVKGGPAALLAGGPTIVAATIPLALVFLSATFVGAMFARSFKELTFVTVTISVGLTTYAFVPAIFTDVTPIALVSPLTIVVMDLQGEAVTAGEYLFSTAPLYCGSAVLFLLGLGSYREEDMFTQKPIPGKVIDAIANRIRGPRSVFVLSILFIPFVFASQLLAVSLLFALPETISLPILFVFAAAVEEFAKSVHVYAGFARSRFEASVRTGAILGALSGVGFFVGEKFTHVVQLVGLPDLLVGRAAFGPAPSSDPPILVAVLLAPLALHVVTAMVSAVGASRGRTEYAMAFVLATLVHAVYNLGVIALVA
ncbi:PrsW family intramembrane metalloprotease [Natrialbaceae archaeon GCM10025810]|uniref:PrsW family intramembrane metalloprotease n=1 Tax=Halovalidus salilacus TaxID=3075124 RepID=UPI0036230387